MEQKNTSLIKNLTEGPLTRQLILFALPIMGANLLQALYTVVDLWVVGQFASSASISAVSISSQIVFLLHAVGIGLGNGGQVLISQQVGAKEYSRLNRTIGTLLSVCMLFSVVAAVVGAVFNDLWLGLMNTPDDAFVVARGYLVICCVGVPFVYGNGTLCAILRGVGDSRRPMYILAVSTIINVVLDLLFVAVLPWGAAGAAWATVIAQAISFFYALFYLYHHRAQLGFDFKLSSFKIDVPVMKVLFRLGAPLVIMSAAINLSMMVVSSFVNVYGVAASSVSGIGSKLVSFINVVTQSLQTAAASLIAQNFAAGKLDRVRRTLWTGLSIGFTFFLIAGTIIRLFPTQIFAIFSPDPEILAYAPEYLRILFWMLLSLSLMSPTIALINGVGFTVLNLAIALLDGVIARIGLAILLGDTLGMGLSGYWWGHALAGYVSVLLGFGYYFLGTWKMRRTLLH